MIGFREFSGERRRWERFVIPIAAERGPGCLAAQVDAGAGRQELIALDGQIGRLDG
jgi:hypothetical protein